MPLSLAMARTSATVLESRASLSRSFRADTVIRTGLIEVVPLWSSLVVQSGGTHSVNDNGVRHHHRGRVFERSWGISSKAARVGRYSVWPLNSRLIELVRIRPSPFPQGKEFAGYRF